MSRQEASETVRLDEFGLKVSFESGAAGAAPIFFGVAELLQAFNQIDVALLRGWRAPFSVSYAVEAVSDGSILVRIRNVLSSVDDDALASGEVRKILGQVLVAAKAAVLRWLDCRIKEDPRPPVDDLDRDLLRIMTPAEAGLFSEAGHLPAYDLYSSAKAVSRSLAKFDPGQRASYVTSGGEVAISLPHGTRDLVSALGLNQSISTNDEVLVIKKPVFIGRSRWMLRKGLGTIEARISDLPWLQLFQEGEVAIKPGDALKAAVEKITISDGIDVLQERYEIKKVHGVVQGQIRSPGDLFDSSAASDGEDE